MIKDYIKDSDNGRAIYPRKAILPIVKRDPRLADIQVNVKRFFTDVDGTILDKNNVAIPSGMKVDYGFSLFGEFDRQGGYALMNKIIGVQGIAKWVGTYVYGKNDGFLQFNTFGGIYDQMTIGDIYHVYTDDLNNPNFFVFVIISNPFAAMGSITANTAFQQIEAMQKYLDIANFKLFVDNNGQYTAPITLITTDSIGTNKKDSLNPYASRSVDDKQNEFIQVNVSMKITQYTQIASIIKFNSDVVNYEFKLRY